MLGSQYLLERRIECVGLVDFLKQGAGAPSLGEHVLKNGQLILRNAAVGAMKGVVSGHVPEVLIACGHGRGFFDDVGVNPEGGQCAGHDDGAAGIGSAQPVHARFLHGVSLRVGWQSGPTHEANSESFLGERAGPHSDDGREGVEHALLGIAGVIQVVEILALGKPQFGRTDADSAHGQAGQGGMTGELLADLAGEESQTLPVAAIPRQRDRTVRPGDGPAILEEPSRGVIATEND